MELSTMTTNHHPNALKLSGSLRCSLAILIVAASLNLSLPLLPGAFTAAGRNLSSASGIIRVAGSVSIDGVQGISGQTIFPGSQVTTAERSESIIDLGKLTRLRLLPETDLTLDFSPARISSTLHKGTVRAFIPAGLPVNIHTAGAELVTDPSQPTEFTVQVIGETTELSVKTGRVELRRENERKTVGAGDVFRTAGVPQSPPKGEDDGLSKTEKIGILAAVGGVAALLLVVFRGREEQEELNFGGCVIILSGIQTCP